MREIKCRGWDEDTKRWYYGSYVRLERTTPYPMSQTPEEDNKKFEEEQVDHYIFFTEMNDWGLETRKLRASVDPKSVGQYTGLRDKNGVQEVYEGDIIDEYGTIKGNIYEMDKGETDLVIEGFGTSAWSKTEKAGLERGLKYSE